MNRTLDKGLEPGLAKGALDLRVLFATKIIEDRNFQPPAFLAMSATLRREGHEVSVVDARSLDAVLAMIGKTRAQVLGISTPSGHYAFFRDVARRVKEADPKIFTVFGGPHTTLAPESVRDEGIDAICRGEGDLVFPVLLSRLEGGAEYKDTPGFWFKEGSEVNENPVAPLIEDLDSLPYGDRALMDSIPVCRHLPVGLFFSSRGCPFACSYCHNSTLHNLYNAGGRLYRAHSPERFIDEIRQAHARYGYRMVMIMSEIFALRRDWLDRFVELYREGPHLPFWSFAHASLVDEHRARKLREANCKMVNMGLEAGNEAFRRDVLNRKETNEQFIEAVRHLQKNGILVQANSMLGVPGSSMDLDLETLEFAAKTRVDVPEACLYAPWPGTPIAERARAEKPGSGDVDTLTPFFTPSFRKRGDNRNPESDRIERLAALFPLAAKVKTVRRLMPSLVNLPLLHVYLIVYKLTMLWYKVRYMYDLRMLFSRRMARLAWTYFRS